MYRCCVIFIALLHLLGGISFSVNNQVNCTQTRSGTPANFFIVTLTQAIFLPTPTRHHKKPSSFLHLPSPMSPASAPPESFPCLREGGIYRSEKGEWHGVVCSNGFTSQEVAMLGYAPLLLHGRAAAMAVNNTAVFWSA